MIKHPNGPFHHHRKRWDKAQQRWEEPNSLFFLVECDCGMLWAYTEIGTTWERLVVTSWLETAPHWYECGREMSVVLVRFGLDDRGRNVNPSLHLRWRDDELAMRRLLLAEKLTSGRGRWATPASPPRP